ncbi:MAG TPA: choice-of-anchor V domain-containing protein [Candidatus Didemnitutus sp.]|nr:choice-of-anchor V domain-containing protein [Candidatus Didemnitutus sp.]
MRLPSLLVSMFLVTSSLFASSSGQAGRTASTSPGCSGSGCHGAASSANPATSLRVAQAVDGKVSAVVGETVTLTVIVSHESRVASGVGIAVKTTETGTTNAGSLGLVTGQGLRLSAGELTHSSPKQFVDREASFSFTWTAPSQAGTYYLRAIANAVNGDGTASTLDQWNRMPVVEVVVALPNSVEEYSHVDVTVSPVPAHENVSVTVPTQPNEQLQISVLDHLGAVVATDNATASGESFRYVWNGRRNDGSLVPQGAYVVAILSDRKLMKGRAIIVR